MGTALVVQGYVETETEWESKHTIPEKGVVERHSKKGEIPVTEGSPKTLPNPGWMQDLAKWQPNQART